MSEFDDTLEDLAGFAWIPGLGQVLDGLRTIRDTAAHGGLDLDTVQTMLALLGNPGGPDLPEVLARLAQDLTTPHTNPALDNLDPYTAKQVQRLGEQHTRDTADYTPRDCTNEAAALISENAAHAGGRCPAVTGNGRTELSKKLKEQNDQSSNRPR